MNVHENRRESLGGATWLKAGWALAYLGLMFLVLPHFGAGAMGLGGAVGFTLMVLVGPDRFRSRKGSLVPAVLLVSALWLMAAGTVLMEWLGSAGR